MVQKPFSDALSRTGFRRKCNIAHMRKLSENPSLFKHINACEQVNHLSITWAIAIAYGSCYLFLFFLHHDAWGSSTYLLLRANNEKRLSHLLVSHCCCYRTRFSLSLIQPFWRVLDILSATQGEAEAAAWVKSCGVRWAVRWPMMSALNLWGLLLKYRCYLQDLAPKPSTTTNFEHSIIWTFLSSHHGQQPCSLREHGHSTSYVNCTACCPIRIWRM